MDDHRPTDFLVRLFDGKKKKKKKKKRPPSSSLSLYHLVSVFSKSFFFFSSLFVFFLSLSLSFSRYIHLMDGMYMRDE